MTSDRVVVQGLAKGLHLLAFLSRFKRMTVEEIARGVGLPRTTTVRLLNTLVTHGFIERSREDRCYQLTTKVRTLSEGLNEPIPTRGEK